MRSDHPFGQAFSRNSAKLQTLTSLVLFFFLAVATTVHRQHQLERIERTRQGHLFNPSPNDTPTLRKIKYLIHYLILIHLPII